MRKTIVLILMTAVLAACGSDIVNTPVPVDVPVTVECRVPAVPQPTWAVPAVLTGASMWERVKALLVDNKQSQAYEGSLQAANASCQ